MLAYSRPQRPAYSRPRRLGRSAICGALIPCALMLALAGQAQAAPGDLDSSFSLDGKQTTDFAGSANFGQAGAVRADGKIVVAGSSDEGATGSDFALARYNADGTLDSSFSDDGKQTTAFAGGSDDFGSAVAVQPDGKIVVGGSVRAPADSPAGGDFALARYNADGTLDSSFSDDGKQTTAFAGGSDDFGSAVAVQPDGKIVVGGSVRAPADSPAGGDFALARYNADGTLDSSFSDDGKQTTAFAGSSNDFGSAVAVQPDGKIVVGGYVKAPADSGEADFALARYNGDGTIDSLFSGDGKQTTDFAGSDDGSSGVAVQADGKIVVAGSSDEGATGSDFALARYN